MMDAIVRQSQDPDYIWDEHLTGMFGNLDFIRVDIESISHDDYYIQFTEPERLMITLEKKDTCREARGSVGEFKFSRQYPLAKEDESRDELHAKVSGDAMKEVIHAIKNSTTKSKVFEGNIRVAIFNE
tara:strand:- start:1880 stop:2263 length:384 start_codon:yes stop_codon:yes gene_type:complete